MWEIWIPSIFPCIPITLWLRQRFRILTFKKDYDNKRFYYQLLSWISIMAVLIIFQNYLTTATGKLNKIKTIDEIEKLKPVRYYEISKFQINQNKEGIYIEIRKSGRRNNSLNYDFYVVFPILKDSLNKQSFKTNYWYGLKFQKQISNYKSQEEKRVEFNNFYKETIKNLENFDFYDFECFEKVPNSNDLENYKKAIEDRKEQEVNDTFIVLEPKKESYENRNGKKLQRIFYSFTIGLLLLLFSLSLSGYSKLEMNKFIKNKNKKK